MPYQSGTASSFADLQSKIETFLTGTPGMTLTSGVLTKTGTDIHVKFGNGTDQITLDIGKDSSAGTLLHTPPLYRLSVLPTVAMATRYYDTTVSIVFPINYEFFYFSTPVNEFRCVIEYNNGYTQNIGFGEINKAVDGAGGIFIDGSVARRYDGTFVDIDIEGVTSNHSIPYAVSQVEFNMSAPMPFGYPVTVSSVNYAPSTMLWFEAGGFDWRGVSRIDCTSSQWSGTKYARGSFTNLPPLETSQMADELLADSLQTYNANNALIQIPLWGRVTSGNLMRIGGVENLRWTNIKHRNFGEIATIGPDKWKHYPAFFKNGAVQDGTDTHSGQHGFAVRYDGP